MRKKYQGKVQFAVFLDPGTHARFKAVCDATDESMQWHAQRAVEVYCDMMEIAQEDDLRAAAPIMWC